MATPTPSLLAADLHVLHLLIAVGIISMPAGLLASALSKARELEDAADATLPKPVEFTRGPCEINREWMN